MELYGIIAMMSTMILLCRRVELMDRNDGGGRKGFK